MYLYTHLSLSYSFYLSTWQRLSGSYCAKSCLTSFTRFVVSVLNIFCLFPSPLHPGLHDSQVPSLSFQCSTKSHLCGESKSWIIITPPVRGVASRDENRFHARLFIYGWDFCYHFTSESHSLILTEVGTQTNSRLIMWRHGISQMFNKRLFEPHVSDWFESFM